MLRLLDESLPAGPRRARGRAVPGRVAAGPLEASRWRITLPEVERAAAVEAVEAFLAAGEVPVERMTKKGLRSFDCRGAVVS